MPPVLWRFVERVLRRAVPGRHLTPILGDLVEDYERRRVILGRVRANVWILREAVALAAMYQMRGRTTRFRSETLLGRLRSDVVQGWRAIRARPGATLATVTVLALGIGLVSAMFALADPYILRPLPYARPNELAEVTPRTFVFRNLPTLADWQARGDLFTDLAASDSVEIRATRLEIGETTLRVAPVSSNYFAVLGVPVVFPADWRTDGATSAAPIVLTATARQRLFGRENAVGRLLRSSDPKHEDLRIVDVLPSSFIPPFASAGRDVDGFVPLGDRPLITFEVTNGGSGSRSSALSTVARLRPGVTHQAIEAALSTVPNDDPKAPFNGLVVLVRPLASRAIAAARTMALGVLGAGLLVLIVSAANVANLLLARSAARTREFAAREALGASRLDIVRLVFVELALLSGVGVATGLLVAKSALVVTAMVIPAQYVTLGAPDLSLRVVLFACAAGGLVILAGTVPAWAAWRVAPSALFSETTSHETRFVRAVRFGMTTAQTTVAVILLVGATLLGRSFINLVTQDPGYDGDTFALQVRLPSGIGPNQPPRMSPTDIEATVTRLARLPGISAVGATTGPFVDDSSRIGGPSIEINGRRVKTDTREVSVGFFAATRSRLVAGRLPLVSDRGRTVVVTESFARTCCDSRSPVGLVAELGRRGFEIVGVVKDVYGRALDEPPGPLVFVPLETAAPQGSVTYVLRSEHLDPALALAAEREVVAANRDVTVSDRSTMHERLMRSIDDRSFATLIAVFFAVAAIGVSAAGLVGIVGVVVARRTREVAIRIAVGAAATDVIRLVTREALAASAAGATCGFAAAFWASRFIEALLYGIKPVDPGSFAAAAAFVVVVVVLAAWIPARRATRLSPTVALRVE